MVRYWVSKAHPALAHDWEEVTREEYIKVRYHGPWYYCTKTTVD